MTDNKRDWVEEVAVRLDSASPAPWEHVTEQVSEEGHYDEPRIFSVQENGELRIVASIAVGRNEENDGPFIAHAPNDVRRLLELVRLADAIHTTAMTRKRECIHEAECDYCDACLYEWEHELASALAAYQQKRQERE